MTIPSILTQTKVYKEASIHCKCNGNPKKFFNFIFQHLKHKAFPTQTHKSNEEWIISKALVSSRKNTMYPAQHYVNGPQTMISTALDSPVASESIAVEALNKLSGSQTRNGPNQEKLTSMQELAQVNKKKTLKDKSKTSRKRSRDTNLSRTLLQASTSKGKDCKPFWTPLSREWSEKLLSCTVTDLRDSDMSCWSSSSPNLMSNSWYTVTAKQNKTLLNETSRTTSLQLQQSLSQAIMDAEQLKTGKRERELMKKQRVTRQPVMRSRRIRVYPTKAQRAKLDQWFGAVRFIYNVCVDNYPSASTKVERKELREVSIKNQKLNDQHPWLRTVPYDVRDSAITDVFEAKKAGIAKNQKGTFKFRTKKRVRQETFRIRGRDWGRRRGAYTWCFSKEKLKSSEALPERMTNTVEITRTRLGEYYLSIPREVDVKSENQATNIVSLDPGVRTFQTIYDITGRCMEWGKDDYRRIYRLCQHMDRYSIFTASVPILVRTSVATVKLALKKRPVVGDAELRERLALLDLRPKLHLYETVLQDIRDTAVATDMLTVALANVEDLLHEMKELLTTVETNLRPKGNADFLYISRVWYDRNEEEMIEKLTVYNTLLVARYDALIKTLQLQLHVREANGLPLEHCRAPVHL